MFDFNFDWSNDINTGIEMVDEQHKELFRIGRKVEQMIITECADVKVCDLRNIIGELRDYISYHFYEEEKLMAEYNYENIDSHKRNHEKFAKGILEIDFDKIDCNTTKDLSSVKTYIQDWIFHHMITEDQLMAQEIKRLM